MKPVRSFRYPKQKCKQVVSKRKGTIVGAKKVKGTILVFACPKGKLNSKTKVCKVGTFLLEKVKAARSGACPTKYRRVA
jgi:hypothetical protein